jgi:hypothetical protein
VRLFLRSSGGLANLRIEDELDTSELAPELARKAEMFLRPEKLKTATSAETSQMTDALQYELVIFPQAEGEELRQYYLSEASTAREILDLIGELMHEIIRRKASRVRKK